MSEFDFIYKGKTFCDATHAPGYVAEFRETVRTSVPRPPRAVLEWGSGTSSLALLKQCRIWNCELFVTIDQSSEYQQAVFANRSLPPFMRIVTKELIGPQAQAAVTMNYSSYPLTLGRQFDLIYIDGRRRVECAYTAMLLSHEQTIVILHDYRRLRYQSMLRMYDVVSDGPQFRVMRPRPAVLKALAVRPESEFPTPVPGRPDQSMS
jgi:hypothetical protein